MVSNLFVRAARAVHVLALGSVVLLSGCNLWPNESPASPAPAPADPAATGTISGIVATSTNGTPLSGVSVKVAGLSAQTAADGSYTLPSVPAGERRVVSFEAAGYAKGVFTVSLPASGAARASARLTPVGATQTFDAASAATVSVPNSAARVVLPAAGLVVNGSNTPASGAVRVEITAVDPAADPANMPGNYTAQLTGGTTGRIESFGALKVTLTDATGARLNLAAGKTATIRIPLSTRSANPPASVPLYYLNEDSGLWVQEGTATLAGTAPNQYYEGTVSHFTYWNADQPTETIRVTGCLQDANGARVAGADVSSTGSDYSGSAGAITDTNGNFSVAMRKGGVAIISAELGSRVSNGVRVGPSEVDITLPACLVFPAAGSGTPPTIVQQPQSVTVFPGGYAFLRVEAIGSPILTYQWRRNGVAVSGATTAALYVSDIAAADSGVSYTVTVSNAFGSVTSEAAVLTVNLVPQAPTILSQPLAKTVNVGATATFDVFAQSNGGTLSFQWLRNGAPITGATASSYTTPAAVAGDSGAAFSVLVSSSNGTSVTSAAAVLTVQVPTPLAITAQPVNVSLNVGQSASFSVTASGGSAALTYQWLRNGSAIAGATAVSYTTPASALADNGARFSVVVTSGSESLTSSAATLSVTQPVGANGYYLIASAGPRAEGSLTFANGTQTLQTQALLAVNSASPSAGGAVTVEPAGQASPLFFGSLEGTVSGTQVSGLRTRFTAYFKAGRLYRVDQVVADGSLPTPQLTSTLNTSELCGSAGLAAQSLAGQGTNLPNASRSWVFFQAPGPDTVCDNADDTYRAVRLDMAATDAPRTVAEPQVDVLNADGSFGGLVVRNGTQMQKLDANLGSPVNLFTIATSGYSNLGVSFGTTPPGIWLFIEGGQLWGVNLANPTVRVSLATLTGGEAASNAIASDGSTAYVALNTGSTSARILRVTEALATTAIATLGTPVRDMALTPTRLVVLGSGAPATLLSLPKAGGTLTTLNTFGTGVSPGQMVASGENVYVSSTQFGLTGSLVSTLVVGADGSSPQTLNGTTIVRSLAPTVELLNLGLDTTYAIVLADGLTSALSSAGATLRVVEGATRNTLLTYGSLPASPDGVLSIGTADPLQYGQPGLLTYFGLSDTATSDLFFFKSDAAGLTQVTRFGAATPARGPRAKAQAARAAGSAAATAAAAATRPRALIGGGRSAAR